MMTKSSFIQQQAFLIGIVILLLTASRVTYAGDYYNVGWLGASALPTAKAIAVPGQKKQFHGVDLKQVMPDSVLQALGLQAGDIIFMANKQKLLPKPNTINSLLDIIERSIAKKKKKVVIYYVRSKKVEKATLGLEEFSGNFHSKSCPNKCDYCANTIEKGLAYMSKTLKNRSYAASAPPQSAVCQVALYGLTFLATGENPETGKYKEEIDLCVKGVTSSLSSALMMQENWGYAYATIFLCELYKQKPESATKALIQKWAKRLIDQQEPSGGWAHGARYDEYREINAATSICLAALGIAKQLDFDVPDDILKKATDYLELCSSGGGVGYSHRANQKGFGVAGRSSGAAIALFSLSRDKKQDIFLKATVSFYKPKFKELPEGHAAAFLHLFNGAILSRRLDGKSWKDYYKHYRGLLLSLQQADGSFTAFPNKETQRRGSNFDRMSGLGWTTSNATLILLLQNKKLTLLLGAEKTKKKKKKKKR